MKLLVFDTETTGVPLWNEPSEHPGQPHLVELAAILLDTDTREEIRDISRIVLPDGWTIPDETAAIHGITTERAILDGHPEPLVVGNWMALAEDADEITSFGISFDMRIMRIAMLRSGKDKTYCDAWALERRASCVMRRCTPVCKLPPTDKMMASGRKTFKTPNLSEACEAMMGRKLEGAHSAMVDARATVDLWFKLRELGA